MNSAMIQRLHYNSDDVYEAAYSQLDVRLRGEAESIATSLSSE